MKKGLLILLLLMFLPACTAQPLEINADTNTSIIVNESALTPSELPSSEPAINSIVVESDIDIEMKDSLLLVDTLETNDEIFGMLKFLLKSGSKLGDEEIALLESKEISESNNVVYLYDWYRSKSLDTIELKILETQVLLYDRKTDYQWDWLSGGRDYLLRVNVINNGEADIPLGVQDWVFQTANPTVGYTSIIPDQLITFEEYKLRMEHRKYEDSVSLIRELRMYWQMPFEKITDIPNEDLVRYVVYRLVSERENGDNTVTQDELNAASIKYLGIEYLDPEDSSLYDPQKGIYTALGWSPPTVYEYFWRTTEDEQGLHFDYIMPGMPLRYTIKDGHILSAIDISKEIDGMMFGIIGTR